MQAFARGVLVVVAGGLMSVAGIVSAQAPGDVDCDGRIGAADLSALVAVLFGRSLGCSAADVNGDRVASSADLAGVVVARAAPPAQGPRIVHFGLAGASGISVAEFGHLGSTPVFLRSAGSGFRIVVEAAPGANGLLPGRTTARLDNPTQPPDLQIGCVRPLGDGNPNVCDGGVPAVAAPHFGGTAATNISLNDLGCQFDSFSSSNFSCTIDAFGNPAFRHADTRLQLCLLVPRSREFPPGDTLCSVRLRDGAGEVGPLASLIIRVGSELDPPTFTPTPEPTATSLRTSTPTVTPTRTIVATAVPTVTPGSVGTATPSATATRTPTRSPSATPVSTGVPPTQPSATATRTASPGPTAVRTATPTSTLVPTVTPTPTRTSTQTRTPTLTSTPTRSMTPTASPTRTRTPTATASPTPTGLRGPFVTYFGLARADENPVPSSGTTPAGVAIFERPAGSGFRIVVEGRAGPSGAGPANVAFDFGAGALPDLQILSSRPLGNGSPAICDRVPPNAGGVPSVDPPVFADSPTVVAAVNDLSCRFLDGGGSPFGRFNSSDSCVQFPANSSMFRFVAANSTIQFCGLVDSAFAFPSGDTLLTVRLRDVLGNVGAPQQIVVRVLPSR